MFTGIIRQVGTVANLETVPCGTRLAVDPVGWSLMLAPGDSVAVSGCCLTVSELAAGLLCFDVIQQTLSITTLGSLAVGHRVNLEPPVTAGSLMSGHVVQGHVDGVGVVTPVDTQAERRLRIEPPAALMETIVDKGSVAVDGVSLTVAALGSTWFEVALVPTTLERTTLDALREGDRVNIETDYLVKAVAALMKQRG